MLCKGIEDFPERAFVVNHAEVVNRLKGVGRHAMIELTEEAIRYLD